MILTAWWWCGNSVDGDGKDDANGDDHYGDEDDTRYMHDYDDGYDHDADDCDCDANGVDDDGTTCVVDGDPADASCLLSCTAFV